MGVCEAGLDTGYDAARTDLAVIGTIGKRLTYRRTDEAYV